MPIMRHPGAGEYNAPESAVPILEQSGWRLASPPAGHQAAPEAPPAPPSGPELIDAVHPGLDLMVQVTAEQLGHLRAAGWMTAAEVAANAQAAADQAEQAARPPKGRKAKAATDDAPAGEGPGADTEPGEAGPDHTEE